MYKFIFFLSLFCLKLDAQLHYTFKELPCLNKEFNLDFHIVQDSIQSRKLTLDEINSKLDHLNEKFAPICVTFKACNVNYIYDYAFDSVLVGVELSKLHREYESKNKFNVFVIGELYIPFNNTGQAICGLSGNSITIRAGCFGSLAHEFGHNFGLAHTFEGSGNENVDGSNCLTAGDGICDTPADPYLIFDSIGKYINADCEFIGEQKDANGEFYQPHVANIMSYYNCPCDHFSRQQFLKMANSITNSYINMW